jgi:methylated-DNA-protein-cysteine methyltransferase-like protein
VVTTVRPTTLDDFSQRVGIPKSSPRRTSVVRVTVRVCCATAGTVDDRAPAIATRLMLFQEMPGVVFLNIVILRKGLRFQRDVIRSLDRFPIRAKSGDYSQRGLTEHEKDVTIERASLQWVFRLMDVPLICGCNPPRAGNFHQLMGGRHMRKWRTRSASSVDNVRGPSESELRILSVTRRIPPGLVCTYGKVAEAAGLPRRARLVGRVLAVSPLADGVPWHRVVNATGRISLRGGDGPRLQARLLRAEGVRVDERGQINLGEYLWKFSKRRKAR